MHAFSSGGKSIGYELLHNNAGAPQPGVIIVYGTRGLTAPFGDLIRGYAKALSKSGMVVMIPDYFYRTGTVAATNPEEDLQIIGDFSSHESAWLDTLQDAAKTLSNLPEVNTKPVGLLGFSLGGHLSLRLGVNQNGTPIPAVAEFFAPVRMPPFSGLSGSLSKMPNLLIHHGKADAVVPWTETVSLSNSLLTSGKVKDRDFEVFFYENEGHGFSKPTNLILSATRTVNHFSKHLR